MSQTLERATKTSKYNKANEIKQTQQNNTSKHRQ